MVQDSLNMGHKILHYPMSSVASEWTSERANERSGAREQSEQSGASKWVSGASKWASEQANGPVLTPQFSGWRDNCVFMASKDCLCHSTAWLTVVVPLWTISYQSIRQKVTLTCWILFFFPGGNFPTTADTDSSFIQASLVNCLLVCPVARSAFLPCIPCFTPWNLTQIICLRLFFWTCLN